MHTMEEEVEQTSTAIAGWEHDNVATIVSAHLFDGDVDFVFVEQRRTYSTPTRSGEARTLEASDLSSAIVGFEAARKWVKARLKRCQFNQSQARFYRPSDAEHVDLRELENHPSLLGLGRGGDLVVAVFENTTDGGLRTWKIDLFRTFGADERLVRSKLFLPEHLDDAIKGLALARNHVRDRQRDTWFDHSREILK